MKNSKTRFKELLTGKINYANYNYDRSRLEQALINLGWVSWWLEPSGLSMRAKEDFQLIIKENIQTFKKNDIIKLHEMSMWMKGESNER